MKNSDKYLSLNTEKLTSDSWWDSLDISQRIEVGSIAVHMRYMSPNYKWACRPQDVYAFLKPGQKKIINSIFSIKNREYSMFPNIKWS